MTNPIEDSAVCCENASEIIYSARQSAVLEERQRVARELHDVVASGLQLAILNLQQAILELPPEHEAAGLLRSIESQIQSCWTDVRRCVVGLKPVRLEQLGLEVALSDYIKQLSNSGAKTHVTFSTCGTPRPLPSAMEHELMRIAQQAVSNAVQHSGAQSVAVQLSFVADGVCLEITDNGSGIDLQNTRIGSGLSGMRERAQQMGANLEIHSGLSHGTVVVLNVPLLGVSTNISSAAESPFVMTAPSHLVRETSFHKIKSSEQFVG